MKLTADVMGDGRIVVSGGVSGQVFLISSAFYWRVFLYEGKLSSFSQILFGFAIFWHQNISEKVASKKLMKLTPGLNFINVLHTAFMFIVPKSVKRH
jgi:hypothetical protein